MENIGFEIFWRNPQMDQKGNPFKEKVVWGDY